MPDVGPPAKVLRANSLRARKRLGQNFLRDTSFIPKILSAADLEPTDEVLEIGAGTGVLTGALAAAAGRVVALELDDRLYDVLRDQYSERRDVEIWHGNALEFDPCDHFRGEYKVIANIPYYITAPLVRYFLEARCQPTVLVLMVQREVAQRMVAAPGDMSLLGVSVQYYAKAGVVARVPAGAFYPRPKVDSAIVRLVPFRASQGDCGEEAFFAVVRAGFSTRRKQLVNALVNGLHVSRQQALDLIAEAGLLATSRAEELEIEEWERLGAVWTARGSVGAG
jgi:16S rRNA (adenine1518-N6/adenine1519-N6)-dimethyltransferase